MDRDFKTTIPRASIKDHILGICAFVGLLLVIGFMFWVIFFLEYINPYSLQRDGTYKICMKTDQCGIEFYVKSDIDKKYPAGTAARVEFEKNVIKDYIEENKDDCHYELWWKWQSVDPNYPTPECDKLQLMGINPTDP
ncbi:DnaJ domain [Artemisia annua]|uniref:DnaJ domain n=1 Tax=Artemisia annua TaxID=35608 RepID=A0A2U1NLP9_ARTAN|nr:DnaJ domain [Artemisia annua]